MMIKHKEYILFFFLVMISGFSVLSYNYSMDDAWIKSDNYINIFSVSNLWDNIRQGYYVSWAKQGRFPGVLPVIRSLDGWFSSGVKYHYFLNLISHFINASLAFYIFSKISFINRKLLIVFIGFYCLIFPLYGPLYAVGLYIGSYYINILSIFLFLLCAQFSGSNKVRILAYSIYLLSAIGNYSIIVLFPVFLVFLIILNENIKNIILKSSAFILPLIINMYISSLSPPTKYLGTKANINAGHIISNLYEIVDRLVPFYKTYDVALMIVLVVFGCVISLKDSEFFKKFAFSQAILWGYVCVFAISSRDSFPNPYFLYIPYFGLLTSLCLVLSKVRFNIYVTFTLMMIMQWFGYLNSVDYKNFRQIQSHKVEQLKNNVLAAKKLASDSGIKNSVILLVVDDSLINQLHLGYYDKFIRVWTNDSNHYVLSTEYSLSGDGSLFKSGFSQYTDKYVEYRNKQDLHELYNSSNNFIDIPSNVPWYVVNLKRRVDSDIYQLKSTPIMERVDVISDYNEETEFVWSKKDLTVFIVNHNLTCSKNMTFESQVFSLIDNKIDVYLNDEYLSSFSVKGRELEPLNIDFTLPDMDKSEIKLKFVGESNIKPDTDSRYLSFYLRLDFDYKLSGCNI
jgi:hypothetical protein